MAFDPLTMLTITIALAAAAALYLAVEWRVVREPCLLFWSAGFALVSVGSTLALLRGSGLLLIGIWFANGLLVTAHWMFMHGVARFTETPIRKVWYSVFAIWAALLLLPGDQAWSKTFLVVNSVLVGALAIGASLLLRPKAKSLGEGAAQLRVVLLGHGIFYLCKTIPALVPGTLIDLAAFRGEIIQISLVEGVMALMLIALSMTGTVRYRREKRIERLASRDPLTSLYNRRALESRAPHLLSGISPASPGALLLIDIDNFKQVNDLHGHAAGDKVLVTLGETILSILPEGALAARLGGDEFIILLSNASSEDILQLGDALRTEFQSVVALQVATPEAVTLSIGASVFEQPPADLAALIERGDIALYESKRGGRNSIRLADNVISMGAA
ncbi:GGDEF domain-containing protein [Pseudomonas matsuisoli]|uniref:diguanylate cyclase n=1 Tax=Pseudomonas matsuisoli TaxID=1515666 RepID=A0A917V0Z9_9PSED|nr:GGDEF domain-containing protein [Pseudomonas matsuisoli]GGK06644.1 hypothetical protein GCM10009304_36020 [Pseudomonas matsuisoli]